MDYENQKVTFIKRSSIILIVFLVALDQIIKLFIAHFMMEAQFTIIPHVFAFQTTQNIHLGWIWHLLDFMMPLYLAVVISVVVILVMVVFYRYLVFLTLNLGKYRNIPIIFLILVLSAGLCKLIDDVFWGGSLDFIQLFNWFIFDLKDVYLTIASTMIIFFAIAYEVQLHKLPKEKRKEEKMKLRLWYWVKLGFPMKF